MNIERPHRRQFAAPKSGVACGKGIGGQWQPDRRRARIAAKGIGLIRPIQPAGAGRVPVEPVLAAVVIFEEHGIMQLQPADHAAKIPRPGPVRGPWPPKCAVDGEVQSSYAYGGN